MSEILPNTFVLRDRILLFYHFFYEDSRGVGGGIDTLTSVSSGILIVWLFEMYFFFKFSVLYMGGWRGWDSDRWFMVFFFTTILVSL